MWSKRFRKWFEGQDEFNRTTLAARLGVSTTSIHFWLTGTTTPLRKKQREIEELTAGAVKALIPKAA